MPDDGDYFGRVVFVAKKAIATYRDFFILRAYG
jgi:hypothetical protein